MTESNLHGTKVITACQGHGQHYNNKITNTIRHKKYYIIALHENISQDSSDPH